MSKTNPCPSCGRETHPHCASEKCGWHRCSNRLCFATLDFKRRRGYRQDETKAFVPVVFPVAS